MENRIKAYKVFNSDWKCRGFQYEVGKTYSLTNDEGELISPVLCESGFHACIKVNNCFNYYDFDPDNKIAEVELFGEILGIETDKQCSNNITIVKEITWDEMLKLANTGLGCSGHSNSGDWNSGDCNSGNRNSGNRNSGNYNSGYCNSGYWNSSDSQNGFFNTISPKTINVFNKDCDIEIWENTNKPNFIYNINLNVWVNFKNMSDEEKLKYPNAFVCNGYLKTFTYKEAWKNAYDSASKEDIKLLKALPNFDADIFEKITGIKINNVHTASIFNLGGNCLSFKYHANTKGIASFNISEG